MWDVVDLDDEAIEEYASNELLGQFLSNTVFRTGILCVILFNGLLIAVETDQELVSAMLYIGPFFCNLNTSITLSYHSLCGQWPGTPFLLVIVKYYRDKSTNITTVQVSR